MRKHTQIFGKLFAEKRCRPAVAARTAFPRTVQFLARNSRNFPVFRRPNVVVCRVEKCFCVREIKWFPRGCVLEQVSKRVRGKDFSHFLIRLVFYTRLLIVSVRIAFRFLYIDAFFWFSIIDLSKGFFIAFRKIENKIDWKIHSINFPRSILWLLIIDYLL